ncbi:MAG: hypothetical protein N4J56_004237 [Chroococcidiopsis sp. SAG 2025]|uniref:hypothetical protein n=1 Tax=Chroococcidiopsis sp. SAG 2025 TaxID=171389 RepID=UPI0029370EFC|nr:hypothetical protein [Chroococcidiopsis sp. SAG 2025]MDV2994583.1 hypothetical protein [Chroococcidiopsis sp. SAG 2025]
MPVNDSMENMVSQKNLHQEAVTSKSVEGTKLITEKPAGRQLNGEKIDVVNPAEYTGLILPVYLAIAAGMLIIFQISRKREQSLTSDFLSRLHQIPCMNCHFYIMNPHLKCAVNPSVVLTRRAIDCPDYRPRNDTSFH